MKISLSSLLSTLCLSIAALVASGAQAAQVGLGVADTNYGFNSDWGTTVLVPINVNSSLRLEPYFSRSTYNRSNPGSWHEYGQSSALGLGVYNVQPAANNTNVLLGVRAELDRSTDHELSGSTYYRNSYNGYSLAPVLGFEYFIVKNLSIGADAAYWFSRETNRYNSGGSSRYYYSSSGTMTDITVKYYFQ